MPNKNKTFQRTLLTLLNSTIAFEERCNAYYKDISKEKYSTH